MDGRATGDWYTAIMTNESVAIAFNDCITRQDLEGLAALLTDDHVLILGDSRIVGKPAVIDAWRRFFAACPDYRNSFDKVITTRDGLAIQGRSSCSVPGLDGPALWRGIVREGKLSLWQVLADTSENRDRLGIATGRDEGKSL